MSVPATGVPAPPTAKPAHLLTEQPGEITCWLRAADDGDSEAARRLSVLVDDFLLAEARKMIKQHTPPVEIWTQWLVDRVYRELVGHNVTIWEPGDREKFFRYALKRMRWRLLDAIKRRPRWGELGQQPHDPAARETNQTDLEFDVQAVLRQLGERMPVQAAILRMRVFEGLKNKEIAERLGKSVTWVQVRYTQACNWCRRLLEEYGRDG